MRSTGGQPLECTGQNLEGDSQPPHWTTGCMLSSPQTEKSRSVRPPGGQLQVFTIWYYRTVNNASAISPTFHDTGTYPQASPTPNLSTLLKGFCGRDVLQQQLASFGHTHNCN